METAKTATILVLLVIAGALGAVTGYFYWISDLQQQRIKQLEADVRTESGKRLDQGENFQEQLEAAHNANALELWEAQGKLDACLKAQTATTVLPKEVKK